MTIFSAHYALAPDGTLLKNPLLHLDDSGKVDKLDTCGPTYTEVHSAQFFSGLLVPGFIADLRDLWRDTSDKQTISRCILTFYAEGTRYVILPVEAGTFFPENWTNAPTLLFNNDIPNIPTSTPWASPWQNLAAASSNKTDITQLLKQYLSEPWSHLLNQKTGGCFGTGYRPGVYVISGIDWQTSTLGIHASIKKLSD